MEQRIPHPDPADIIVIQIGSAGSRKLERDLLPVTIIVPFCADDIPFFRYAIVVTSEQWPCYLLYITCWVRTIMAHNLAFAAHVIMVGSDMLHDSRTPENLTAIRIAAAKYPEATFLVYHNDGKQHKVSSDNEYMSPRRFWAPWSRWVGLHFARTHNLYVGRLVTQFFKSISLRCLDTAYLCVYVCVTVCLSVSGLSVCVCVGVCVTVCYCVSN
jgi:hypothetical protein